MKIFSSSKVIFEINSNLGQKLDCLRIIFSGKFGGYRLSPYQTKISSSEYIKILKEIYDKDDELMLDKVIYENKTIFPFNIKDVSKIDSIAFNVNLKRIVVKYPSIESIETYFNENTKYSMNAYNIGNLVKSYYNNDSSFREIISNKILNILKTRLSDKILNFYSYLEFNDKKTIRLFEYEKIFELGPGQTFGDHLVDRKNFTLYYHLKIENIL